MISIGEYEFSILDCAAYDFIQMTPSLCRLNLNCLVNTHNIKLFVGGENLTLHLLQKILSKFKPQGVTQEILKQLNYAHGLEIKPGHNLRVA